MFDLRRDLVVNDAFLVFANNINPQLQRIMLSQLMRLRVPILR